MKRLPFFLLLLFLGNMQVQAQTRVPVFQICRPPVNVGLRLTDSINTLIAVQNNWVDVQRTINAVLRANRYRGTLLKIRKQPAGPGQRLRVIRYVVGGRGTETDGEQDRTVFRGNEEIIYYIRDFQTYFGRSLNVLDTLRLRIILKDEQLPVNRYYLKITEKDGGVHKIALPAVDNQTLLIFPIPLVEAFRMQMVDCALYHADESSPLATFRLHFLNPEELVFLRNEEEIFRNLNKGSAETDDQEIARYLSALFSDGYGEIKKTNILDWLKRRK